MGLSQSLDLATLVRRAQAGDSAAFETIYHHFADPIFRFLYARCGDAGLAEELAGDFWVRVVEQMPRFRYPADRGDAVFAGWLYRIARNMVIDAHRQRAKSPLDLDETTVVVDEDPNARVIAAEDRDELRAAVEQLTPEQREVVLLRFVEERSHAEVAMLTGSTEGAVKVMQHRALKALARAFRRGPKQTDER